MPRIPKATDFSVKVEGIGTFTFARRTMADEIAIQREYAIIIDGVENPTDWLRAVGGWLSAFRVLTVRAPDGWDLDAMDPLDPDTYTRMFQVFEALTEQERSFRRKPEPAGQGAGA